MRKLLFTFLITVLSFAVFGQTDTSYWKTNGIFSFKVTQAGYKNWAAGGENSISGIGNFKYQATYTKGKSSWDNLLLADLGFLKQGKNDASKTDDRFEFNSKYGYGFKKSKHWYYSALFNFKTQLLKGYDYKLDTPAYISNFMSPAYIKFALGIDYIHEQTFTLFISPATARWTIVNDQTLADAGSFGLDPATVDAQGNIVHASKTRLELGAYLRMAYTKDLMENINLLTKLELYSNYLKEPQNIDVDLEVVLNFKVNKYFTASLATHMIYDHDIAIGIDSNNDGIVDYYGPRAQWKEVLGIGFAYKF